MKVELTEEQMKNIEIFLDRVNFQGRKEALALTEILQAFHNARNEEE